MCTVVMDEIESDHLLVVPDTPEKLTTTHKSIFNDHTNTNCGICLSTRPGNDRSIFKGTGGFKRVIHVKKNSSIGDKHDDRCNHMVSRFIGSHPSIPSGGCHFQSGDNMGLHCEKVNGFTRINTQLGETRDKYRPDKGEPSQRSPSKAFKNRRLVRNGCISPSNVSMAKQAPDCPIKANVIDKDGMHQSGSHCMDGLCRDSSEAKGKSIVTCSVPSTENDLRSKHPTSRNLCDGCEGFDGWRSIRPKRGNSNEGIFDGCGGNSMNKSLVGLREVERGRESDKVDLIHSLVREPVGGPNSHISSNGCTDSRKGDGLLRDNKNVKRLRMKGPHSVSGCSEVIVIGSPMDISVPDVERSRYCPHMSGHNSSVIEIEGSPGSTSARVTDNRDHAHSDYSYAMERQLEEDEIFALKIQEQLYNEYSPVDEVDLQMARSLQQTAAPPDRSRTVSVRRSPSSRVAAPRPARVRLNENLNRRGIQARASTTTTTTVRNRLSILRRRIRNQPNSVGHGSRTPSNTAEADMELENVDVSFDNMLNMCLELRMDILEAMEETFGDQSDARDGRALGVGRDLDLNDYEMLLALDENNHEHRGATAHLISTLPESVLQGDTFVDHCVICLEIPKSGDYIRHLPCLHKFHKHCIDAWLGRKTSCPVCNSSVF